MVQTGENACRHYAAPAESNDAVPITAPDRHERGSGESSQHAHAAAPTTRHAAPAARPHGAPAAGHRLGCAGSRRCAPRPHRGQLLLLHCPGADAGRQGPWDQNLVYSLAIGMVSWAVIEAGRITLARREEGMWPRGWRGIALVAAGTSSALGGHFAGRPVVPVLHLGTLAGHARCAGHGAGHHHPGHGDGIVLLHSRGTARALQAASP